MLNIFCQWAQQTIARLPAGIEAHLTLNADSENRSARLDVDASEQMGRITFWHSGDFHLEILDAASGVDLLDRHGKINSSSAMLSSLEPFLEEFGIN